jgi:hypothetical protein
VSSITSSNKKEKLSSKMARVLNSAMAFIIAYMIVIFLFSVVTALAGKIFGFDSSISLSGVKFDLGHHKWEKGNVAVVWSFGTFFTAMLGFIFFYLFSQFKTILNVINLVFLWGAVIAYSIVAAQLIMPCIEPGQQLACYTNLAVVFTWLAIPVFFQYLLAAVAVVFLALFSIYASKPFLSFSYSFSKVSKSGRKRKFFFETVLVPFALASFVFLTFTKYTYPSINFKVINLVYMSTIAFSLLVSFLVININDVKSDEVLRYKTLQKTNPVLFLLLIILLIFFTTMRGFYLPF